MLQRKAGLQHPPPSPTAARPSGESGVPLLPWGLARAPAAWSRPGRAARKAPSRARPGGVARSAVQARRRPQLGLGWRPGVGSDG